MWAGPGPNINGPGMDLNSSLWARARLVLTNFCRPGPDMDSNCYLWAGLGLKL